MGPWAKGLTRAGCAGGSHEAERVGLRRDGRREVTLRREESARETPREAAGGKTSGPQHRLPTTTTSLYIIAIMSQPSQVNLEHSRRGPRASVNRPGTLVSPARTRSDSVSIDPNSLAQSSPRVTLIPQDLLLVLFWQAGMECLSGRARLTRCSHIITTRTRSAALHRATSRRPGPLLVPSTLAAPIAQRYEALAC